jgi:biotin-dependent carboxylase-like uncharacterized protein
VAVIEVVAPGAFTTIQDLGRFGHGAYGISPGGAFDRFSLRLANLLVGNPPGAAALEATLLGPRLRFTMARVVAIAGADLGATLDGAPAPFGRAFEVAADSELGFAGGDRGVRAYLAIAGGLDGPLVLGSRSTDLRGGFGGVGGRALRRGDRLAVGPPRGAPRPLTAALRARLEWPRDTLRIVPGADGERFGDEAAERLGGEPFVVLAESDRMGVRLEGPALELRAPFEKVSEGIAPGAIQVPPSGAPVVLGVDHPSTGGYPQIAAVVAADLPALAQLRPRRTVRFSWVDFATARAALAADEALLAELAG